MWIRLYTLLYALALPLVLLRLLLRGWREPGYRHDLRGRFGAASAVSAPTDDCIWLHAVSAGEVVASVPLLQRLRVLEPERALLVTVTTATGRARAQALLGAIAEITWLPFDLPLCLEPFLAHRKPALLLLMETELWPNLLASMRARARPVLLVNARLSARSARGYARIPGLAGPMLEGLQEVLCQDARTRQRFLALGMPADRVRLVGSLKFEPWVPAGMQNRVAALRRRLRTDVSFLVVAGSTHAGEEAMLLQALAPLLQPRGSWRLVLAPRHPERFGSVWEQCRALAPAALRMSSLADDAAVPSDAGVLLFDRMGELFALYGVADVAFLGGSLVRVGGHNPIEAAWHGVPVISGPHLWNFETTARQLGAGLVRVADAQGLRAELLRYAGDPEMARARGAAGRRQVRARTGALERTLERVRVCVRECV